MDILTVYFTFFDRADKQTACPTRGRQANSLSYIGGDKLTACPT
jgi:hypothetical protein